MKTYLFAIFFLLLGASHYSVYGQSKPDTISSEIPQWLVPNEKESDTYVLWTFAASVNPWMEGITPIRRLSDTCWVVKKGDLIQRNISGRTIRISSDWKLSPNLLHFRKQDWKKAKLITLVQLGKERTSETVEVNTPQDLEKLLQEDDIIYLGWESRQATTEATVIDHNLTLNAIQKVQRKYPQFQGEGRVVSVQERGFDTLDIDLQGRSVNSALRSDIVENHATEMASLIGGAGNSFVTGKGVVPQVQFASSDYQDIAPDADVEFARLQAWVQNHSYGTEIENFYGELAHAYDASANRNPSLLHVFSSGNQGTSEGTGAYEGVAGYANLTGNYKMAKNILVVGSSDTIYRAVSFASKGPSFDGRLKPELVAYSQGGSSNSAALVSGIVVLLQEAYATQYGTTPSSVLIKSLLFTGAEDVGAEGPDYATGFGSMHAEKSLQILMNEQFVEDNINSNEVKIYTLQIPEGQTQLSVSLVWNDPAAEVNTNKALINDLDLELIDANGQTWLPWVLNPDANQITASATRGVDQLNNAEKITLDLLPAGEYTLRVKSSSLVGISQSFALSYQWQQADTLVWDYPVAGDNLPHDGEQDVYFRWRSTLQANQAALQISYDQEQTWETIANTIDLRKGFYRWEAPEVYTQAKARLVVGANAFPTETFTISRPIRLNVGFNCSDSVMWYWNKPDRIEQFRFFRLGAAPYLQEMFTTTDTSYVFRKSEEASTYFAVQPIISGMEGLRGYAFDYTRQGIGCYLVGFFGEAQPEEGIRFSANLGTSYGVKELRLERENAGIWETVHVLTTTTASSYELWDLDPFEGKNLHRLRIVFENNEELESDITEIYYLNETAFIAFPNPLEEGESLIVLTNTSKFTTIPIFSLYDRTGRQVWEQKLFSEQSTIDFDRYVQGLYFYSIRVNNRTVFRGKVLVR
ncbi:S8 family peptidase [Cytophagales bacterium LB-30]|uniref:S8 family peptidase n=1 Tax=Shiella aurantiaca TaxID=3058365 RepID=A0ABT8F0L6_9BACT|nr:S8 family peptidase [Shiella aurantiaca]MDN4163996.1 S8 family peptidase [Shiella aurantiaca]